MTPIQIGFVVLCLAVAAFVLFVLAKISKQPQSTGQPENKVDVVAERKFHSNVANMNAPWKVIGRR